MFPSPPQFKDRLVIYRQVVALPGRTGGVVYVRTFYLCVFFGGGGAAAPVRFIKDSLS
jgi:hypothetical protein